MIVKSNIKSLYKQILHSRNFVLLAIFLLSCIDLFGQGLVFLEQNSTVRLSPGSIVRINGSIQIENGASLTQSGAGNIYISGDWICNGGIITPGSLVVSFLGSGNSIIGGTSQSTFYDVVLDKTLNTILLSINSDLRINNDLTLNIGEFRAGTGTNTMTISGDIANGSRLDLDRAPAVVNTVFDGTGNSVVSGVGLPNEFNEITVSKSLKAEEVRIESNNFSATPGFLTLNTGTFHILGNFTYSNTTFKSAAGNYDIPGTSGFWLENSNYTVTGQNATANLTGLLRLTNGTINVGTGSNQNHLLYNTGAELTFEDGIVNVVGRFSRNAAAATINYTQSNGEFNVGTGVVSSAADRGNFDIGSLGSTFNWSGGTIRLKRHSLGASGDYVVLASTGSVTGGLFEIDAAVVGVGVDVNSTMPVYEYMMTGTNNPSSRIETNNLTVLTDLTIDGTGGGRLNANGLDITIGGNWINNGDNLTAFSAGTGTVLFNGSSDQNIQGSVTTFNNLSLNKSAGIVYLQNDAVINRNVNLISSLAKIDIQSNNITIGSSGAVYSDNGTTTILTSFSTSKSIYYSATDASGGNIIKQLAAGTISTPTAIRFPLSTQDPTRTTFVYTPAEVTVNDATIGANANITIKPIPLEHPNVLTNNLSLTKYWSLSKTNVTLTGNLCDLRFWYDDTEVVGNEGNYRVLKYNSTWMVDPGLSSIVNFNNNLIFCERPTDSDFNGDWTAGEEQAARAKYYSLANGNYNDPNSWSKISFGGPVSNTAPSDPSDQVFIGDEKTITITANPGPANLIEIQNASSLLMQGFVLTGDTCRVEPGGTIGIGDAVGISSSGLTGNVRTTLRLFDTAGIYMYTGNLNQVTGTGLPNRVRSFIVDKTGGRVDLGNNVLIGDSLIINNGLLRTRNFTINAENPNRSFRMRGGEIELNGDFPLNYSPPTFTAGTVNFNQTTPIDIPSSLTNPGVAQYNNLTIGNVNRGYSTITLGSLGEIRIFGNFIYSAVFNTFDTPRMLTTGSTVRFNGPNDQNIPRNSGSNRAREEINYYNLIIDGSNNKRLTDGTITVLNDITLESANLDANGRDLIVQGNWSNTGGTFEPETRRVTFNVTTAATTKNIQSSNQPFYDVTADGLGFARHTDNMTILSDLTVNSNATFGTVSSTLFLEDDITINGAFSSGTGTVIFSGDANQQILNNSSGSGNFYDVKVDKTGSEVLLAASSNMIITNTLEFIASNSGVIDSRTNNRFVEVRGSVSRNGLGHVDGNLRIQIPSGATAGIAYHIGAGTNYRPVLLSMNGTGGTSGLLNIIDQPRSVSLIGAGLNTSQNVERQWEITSPTGSTFNLGTRKFDLVIQYLNPADIRGGADPLYFETRNWNGAWISPSTGTRTANTTQSIDNASLGSFVVGPPGVVAFYSIDDGDWSNTNSWSTAGYGGPIAPSAPAAGSKVYIGDGKRITLDVNYNTVAGDSIVVETAGTSTDGGHLILGNNIISGAGAFALRSGGILSIGEANGISLAAANGNIRTANRNYNENNHDNGHFIYNGAASQVTGNGLPTTVATLTINNPGNTVDLQSDITVNDSLHIANGTLDVTSSDNDITLKGNWRNEGSFNERSAEVTFAGTTLQIITNSSGETFNDLTINNSASYIKLENSSDIRVLGTLDLTAGVIDAETNSLSVTINNGGSVNRTAGHIYGELRKYVPTDASVQNFEVGSIDDYTPANIDFNGTGGTAGYIGVRANDFDHPQISGSGLNLSKNVQRYWELMIPSGSTFGLGARDYDLTLTFQNPDDIRGGADPLSFITRQYSGSAWNNTTAGSRTSTTTEATGITVFGDEFVIGEPGTSREFWTRADGDWDDFNTWSTVSYGGGNALNEWPDDPNDIIYIGNGNEVNLNVNSNISSVTVEDVSGQGIFRLNNFVLSGNQFTLKTGGMLRIGSVDGITASGATGNIQTTIRNYNHNNHDSGYFEFIGSAANTGDGLPAIVAYLGFNSSTTTDLTNNVSVKNEIAILAGNFDAGANNISLQGNWINNSGASAFVGGTGDVIFNGTNDQTISGSETTTFNELTVNKANGRIILDTNIIISSTLDYSTNSLIVLNDNDITIDETAVINGAGFGSNKMIQSDGTASSGSIIKNHTSGTGVTRSFTYPIGTGSDYNPTTIAVEGDFAAGANIAVRLRSGLHPLRTSDNVLNKFWTLSSSGVTAQATGNTDFDFNYLPGDVNGNQALYIPARNTSGVWEINLGTSRDATSSPISVIGETGIDGDWIAGEPKSIMIGRIYYSRQNGDWTDPDDWSNVSHAGPPCIYYPGQIHDRDTVIVADSDDLDYDIATGTNLFIDSLKIGGSGDGEIDLQRGTNKKLTILRNLLVETNGSFNQTGSGSRYDTLVVHGNIENYNVTAGSAIDFRFASDQITYLLFAGDINSTVIGEGTWDLSGIELNKVGGLSDSLINESASFSDRINSGTSTDQRFYLTSGVYRHDNTGTARLDRDGGTLTFIMGVSTGIDMRQGSVEFDDNLQSNTNTTIDISGGVLNVGDEINEDFDYEQTYFNMTGGAMIVSAGFKREQLSSICDFNMSGGTLTIVDIGSNRYGGTYGFNLSSACTMNWSGGTIIYARATQGDNDYLVSVNSDNYNITGGTLQFGRVGDRTLTGYGNTHSFGSTAPIWNLFVAETRTTALTYSSLILLDQNNTILNDIIIGAEAALDLNGKNISCGGDYINSGYFETHHSTWTGSDNSKVVTFDGAGDQTITISNAIQAAIDNGTIRNEAFYDVNINKPSGRVILANTPNSNMIVRNNLKFFSDNVGIIDSRANNKIVQIDPQLAYDIGQIQRFGLGHIDGTLRQNINTGAQNVVYHIGADFDYTPMTVETVGAAGTAGPVDAIAFGTTHPQLASNLFIDPARDIDRYWSLSRPTGSFDLGGRTFDVTAQFLNTDVPGGANWSLFEQYIYRNPGPAWLTTTTGDLTQNSTQSVNNATFNNSFMDFVVGELYATNFYSIADGNWNDGNNWSLVGYDGPAAGIFPNAGDHQAYIGDGKTITLNQVVTLKAAIVEDAGDDGPGHLDCGINWIQGDIFTLNNNCYLSSAHEFGLRAGSNIGSIRTTTRNYGTSHYIYNSSVVSQSTGDGLPTSIPIASLTINNTAADSASSVVFLINDVDVLEDLNIMDGNLFASNKIIQSKGDFLIGVPGRFIPSTSTVTFNNLNLDQNILLDNSLGVTYNNLHITKDDGAVIIGGLNADADVYVGNHLRFTLTNNGIVDSRANDRKVIINPGAVVERNGLGHVDGILQKPVLTNTGPYNFEIGYDYTYTPAEITFDQAGGTAGAIDAIATSPVPPEPFSGNRMDVVLKVDYFWTLEGQNGFNMGVREANINFSMPPAEVAPLNLNNVVVRRRSIPAEPILWTERRYDQAVGGDLLWTPLAANVELDPSADLWPGLGQFYIGEKAKRVFYSRQDGDWDDNNSWAFDQAELILAPPGEYPNNDWDAPSVDHEYEIRDSVVIDDNEIITLNTLPELANMIIMADGTLIVPDGQYLRQSRRGVSIFEMSGNGWINNKSVLGIESDTTNSIIRFEDRSFGTTNNFEFSGILPQTFGDAFPGQVDNIVISNTGAGPNGIVESHENSLIINEDLDIQTGELRPYDGAVEWNLFGNLTVDGIFEGTLDPAGATASSEFIFSGSGAVNQTISGAGTVNFYDLSMNRGAGAGIVELNKDASVLNILDLRKDVNPNDQIIGLGFDADLTILNSDPNAILDYTGVGQPKYIRTSNTSGLLIRNLTQGNTYIYPIGSFDAANNYAPAEYTAENSGVDGTIGIRTSRGTSAALPNAHLYLDPARATDYITRYWAVDNVTTTIPGELKFHYINSEVVGVENDIVSIGRWRPVKEGAGGAWRNIPGNVNTALDEFASIASYPASEFLGDWTIANAEAFRRIFFSRLSGNWNDPNIWTSSSTHIGPIYGPGVWPNDPLDSVVVGGGNTGLGNHEVVLNVTPPVGAGFGLSVGTGTTNTGTLDLSSNIIGGSYFTLGDYSTLRIGHPQGISALPALTGNIQTTETRVYTGPGINAIFEYTGTTDQIIGSGLPINVRSLGINNSGIAGNNTVTTDKPISIMENLYINLGRLDIVNHTINNTSGSGDCSILAGGTLRVGSTNDLSLTIDNYSTYTIDIGGEIEFYGGIGENQYINRLPANLINGLGLVTLNNGGIKIVEAPLLIRGNLNVINNARLENNLGVDALTVEGSIYNASHIDNNGVIEIGK